MNVSTWLRDRGPHAHDLAMVVVPSFPCDFNLAVGVAVAANDEGPAGEPNLAGLALRAEVGYALAPTPN